MTAITDYNPSFVCGIQLSTYYFYFVILSLQKRKLGVVYSIMSVGSTLGLQGVQTWSYRWWGQWQKVSGKGVQSHSCTSQDSAWSQMAQYTTLLCEIQVLKFSYWELLGGKCWKKVMIILDCFLNHIFKKGFQIGLEQFLFYFRHTSVLESYNSMMTKYVPKRMAFE